MQFFWYMMLIMISLSEIDNYKTHIIATFALSAGHVWRDQSVKQPLAYLGDLNFSLHLNVDVINDLLTGLCFPDAIAAHDHEICFVTNLVYFDIGKRCYCLLLKRQFQVLLVSNIANCSGKIEVSIDSTFDINGGACFVDTLSFAFESWLVIKRKRNSPTVFSYNSPRVSSVSTNNHVSSNHTDIGRASLALHVFN
jgi:hypothetical protein